MKQKTEVQLCKALMELLKKYPFQKITIQKIAEQCGVNRQTFYYHFDNIYDLMARAFEYELNQYPALHGGLPWEEVMRAFLKWMQNNRIIIKNVLVNVEKEYLRRAIYPFVSETLEKRIGALAFAGGESRPNDEFVRRFLTLGMTQYIYEWAENDFREDVEYIIQNHEQLFQLIYR